MQIEIPSNTDEEAAKILSWVIRGFFVNICECYIPDSVRRPEAYALSVHIVKTSTCTDEAKAKILAEIDNINNQVFPKV